MKALVGFLPLLRPHIAGFALALLASLVALTAGVALLGVSGWFLTATALTGLGVSFNLFAPSAAVRGLSFMRILARYGEKLSGHDATLRLLSEIRRWLFHALFPRLPLDGRKMRHGDLVSRLTGDVDALDTIILVAIGPLVGALALGAAVSVALMVLLPEAAGPYAVLLMAAVILVPVGLAAASRSTGRVAAAAGAELRVQVLDAIVGHDDVVLLGREDTFQERFTSAAATLGQLRSRQALLTALANVVVQMLTAGALVSILWFGLAGLEADRIEGPMVAGLVFAAFASFESTAVIVRTVGRLSSAVAAAERLRDIAAIPPAIVEAPRTIALPPGGDLVLDAVHFAYDVAPVLNGVSLWMAAGERVAIIGRSGCGKSTLLDLVMRLNEPQAGRILVAGADIREVPVADLHSRVALLRQDSPVFLDTVRNNLLLANPNATDSDLWHALEAVRVDETISALPYGLATLLGEDASTLSAGQARRLCLARVLLSPARIVLLDEPTSGLDRETEIALIQDIPRIFEHRTVLLATHAALPGDAGLRRLVLANGRLTESGPVWEHSCDD